MQVMYCYYNLRALEKHASGTGRGAMVAHDWLQQEIASDDEEGAM